MKFLNACQNNVEAGPQPHLRTRTNGVVRMHLKIVLWTHLDVFVNG